jgi:hypothetical protein
MAPLQSGRAAFMSCGRFGESCAAECEAGEIMITAWCGVARNPTNFPIERSATCRGGAAEQQSPLRRMRQDFSALSQTVASQAGMPRGLFGRSGALGWGSAD